ncbi:MAG: hypothetical protein OD814_000401 [Candidatus Alkanophagales archaeon MCA70_species_1]|nr:hypothetical protein [Candidatus Alkanophaga volatiphilum]
MESVRGIRRTKAGVGLVVLFVFAFAATALLSAAAVATATATAADVTIESATVERGGFAYVNVTIENVPPPGLGAYSLLVSYDPAVVSVEEVYPGDPPFGTPAAVNIDNEAGEIRFNDYIAAEEGPGNVTVVRLGLRAVGSPGDESVLDVTVLEVVNVSGALVTATAHDGVFRIIMPTVALEPASVVLHEGETATLNVTVHDVPEPGLGAYSLEIAYDPSVVVVEEVLGGEEPFGEPAAVNVNNTAGWVAFNDFITNDTGPRDVTVASLRIKALAAGSCTLNLTVRELSDAGAEAMRAADVDAVVTVLALPVNVSIWTDKDTYGVGDLQRVFVSVRNPGGEKEVNVVVKLLTPLPWCPAITLVNRTATLPAGLDVTVRLFAFRLPRLPPGTYTWVFRITYDGTVAEDRASWTFVWKA